MEQAEPSRLMLQIAGEPGDAQEILDMSGLVDANAADDGIRTSTRDKLSLDAASHRHRAYEYGVVCKIAALGFVLENMICDRGRTRYPVLPFDAPRERKSDAT